MRRKITNEIWMQIETAYASGIGLREIARNMNISEGTVLAHAQRKGWSRRIQSVKALAKHEDALSATPVEAAAISMQKRGERHIERMAGISERGVNHVETMNGPEILDSVDQIEKLDKVARRTFSISDDAAHGEKFVAVNIAILDVNPVLMTPEEQAISCNQEDAINLSRRAIVPLRPADR